MTDPRIDNSRVIRADRGSKITAKSWQTEAAKRMLMNNLDPEVAENPDALVVYGGIGRAAAVLFAKQGANVVCSDVDDKLGHETLALVQKAGAEGIYVHADVTSRQEVRALVKQAVQTFGKISFLFNFGIHYK